MGTNRRSERNETGNSTGGSDHWLIAIEERFHDDHLISDIDVTENGTVQRLIGSSGHQNLPVLVDWSINKLRIETLQCLHQSRMAKASRVLHKGRIGSGRRLQRFDHIVGWGIVRESLSQVQRLMLQCQLNVLNPNTGFATS